MKVERDESDWVTEVSSEDEGQTEIDDEELLVPQEILDAINAQAHKEAMEEVWANDPVAQRCIYRRFISTSNGRNRSQRNPRLVELVGYNGKYYTLVGDNACGKVDEIAADVLRDIVPPEMAFQTFLIYVRRLPNSHQMTKNIGKKSKIEENNDKVYGHCIHEGVILAQIRKTGETEEQVVARRNKISVENNDPKQVYGYLRILRHMLREREKSNNVKNSTP